MYIYIISLPLNCTVRPHGIVTSQNENRSSLSILHVFTNLKRFTCARKDQPQKAQFRYVMPATDNSGKQDLKEFKLFSLFFCFDCILLTCQLFWSVYVFSIQTGW